MKEEREAVTLVSSGLKLFGILHLPHEAKMGKVPAVLFCHGFGGNKSGKFRMAVRQAERFSEVGIASLRIDFRGSGDSEGDFSDTTIKTELEDAKVAMQFLLNHPAIDTTKIALLGRSLGGAVAAKLAAEYSVRGAALICPLFDAKPWIEAHKNSPIHFMGQKLTNECIDQFRSLDLQAPLAKTADIAMLIVRAGQDEILGPYHHEGFLAARAGCPNTKTHELAKSTHDIADPNEQIELLDITTKFMREIL